MENKEALPMRHVKLIFLACLITTLVGCVYHPPIQQGNIITDKDLSTLHEGITKNQVRTILDDPVLVNIFADNRMVYVYTCQLSNQIMQSTRLIIHLCNNHVTNFWTDKNKIIDRINLSNPYFSLCNRLEAKR